MLILVEVIKMFILSDSVCGGKGRVHVNVGRQTTVFGDEDLSEDRVAIGLHNILIFATGADHIPPMPGVRRFSRNTSRR